MTATTQDNNTGASPHLRGNELVAAQLLQELCGDYLSFQYPMGVLRGIEG